MWVCLLLTPFIALHVADGKAFDVMSWFMSGNQGLFFPFISGKNLLFRMLVEVAFAGWAVLALYDASYRVNIKKSPIMIAYTAFTIVLLLADLFGVDREKSMWSNFERMEGFVGHIHFFAYFFVLTVMVKTLNEWRTFWKYSLVANGLVLIYAYGQLMGAKGLIIRNTFPKLGEWFSERFPIHMSDNRLDATIGNSAYFAILCLMCIFIAAILWSQSKEPKKKWWYPVLIVLNLIALFYSGTRGTLLGILAGGFITVGILAWHERGRMMKVFATVVILFVVGVGSLLAFKDTQFVKSSPTLNRMASISSHDVTGASRLSMWKISYEAWLERPVLGYGQDNFSYVFARKFLPERMCNLEPWYDRSHNVFFDWLVAAGILGLLTYLSLYGVTLWYMWKHKNHDMPLREKALVTGLLAGYFIHNFFVFDNLTSYILFFAVLAYVTVRTRQEATGHGGALFDKDQMNLLVIPVIGITLLVTQYYINFRPLIVNRLVIDAMSFGNYVKTLPFPDAVKRQQDDFTTAIDMNTLGSLEAREQFMQMVIRMSQIKIPDTLSPGDKQTATEALNKLMQVSHKTIDDSHEAYKTDVRMLSIYGMFLVGTGDALSAEKVLSEAHTLAPNKQLISYDLIRAYLLQRKMDDAYKLAKETYDLGINCNDALRWYMVSAAYAGKYEEANAYSQSKGQTYPVDVDVILGVVASGQKDLAIKMLQEMKKKDPSLAPQIDEFIKQILAQKK